MTQSEQSNETSEVTVYDHDGFPAKVSRADLTHWLQKGFVEKFGHSDIGTPNASEESA